MGLEVGACKSTRQQNTYTVHQTVWAFSVLAPNCVIVDVSNDTRDKAKIHGHRKHNKVWYVKVKTCLLVSYLVHWAQSRSGELRTQKLKNTELKRFPFKAWSRSVYSHTCYAHCQGFLSCSPKGRPGMSDVSLLSGISGLSFDSTLLSPLLFFCQVLLPFLSYRFLPASPRAHLHVVGMLRFMSLT